MKFYISLAWNNIHKYGQIYHPLIIALSFMLMVTLVMINITFATNFLFSEFDVGVSEFFFGFGSIIVVIMTFILSWYANNFVLRQRIRQLSLYSVIGFSKNQLRIMLFFEKVFCLFFILIIGSVEGAVFSRLGYLILGRILGVDPGSNFGLNPSAFKICCTVMTFLFIFLFILDILWLRRNDPKSIHQEKKEPKIRWILLFIGILTLGSGYMMAVKIKEPLAAFFCFFVAVLLVIIGTYALFISASIFILKLLRNNSAYYYKPRHFINLGNLLTRMKENGAGLASITILITMSLVTIHTSVTMFLNSNKFVDSLVPTDLVYLHNNDLEDQTNLLKTQIKKEGAKIVDERVVRSINLDLINLRQSKIKHLKNNLLRNDITKKEFYNLKVMQVSDFNVLMNKRYKLLPNEVIIAKKDGYSLRIITIGDQTYNVKKVVTKFDDFAKEFGEDSIYLIFANDQIFISQVNKFVGIEEKGVEPNINCYHLVKLQGSQAQQFHLSQQFMGMKFRVDKMGLAKTLMSSVLFVGILSALAFILATFLILYYKQISEGYADAKRYHTLERVGLSKSEVKKDINSQLKVVFYLPLAVSLIHLIFSTPIINCILTMFGIEDIKFWVIINLLGFGIFSLFYVGMYKITANAYYRIVTKLELKELIQ